jgi:DNA-binding IclR family transcriptional regulator
MDQGERIPTNLRTLRILEVLGQNDRPMTATEINAHLGLPRQTVHRLCTTLETAGFLVRHGTLHGYQPSRRLREMGAGLLYASRSDISRHQVLLDLAQQVRETVNLVVPEETGMRYVDRVETDWPFRIQLPVGSNVPFHCTASGKTYMASLTPRARRAFVAGLTLTRQTATTHVTAKDLLADLDRIAKRGYALDQEEFMDGMVAVAVPVRDTQGRFIAALAFHGPAQRIDIDQAIARKDILTASARKLTDALLS